MVITVLLIFQMVTVDARVTYGVGWTETDDVNFRRNKKLLWTMRVASSFRIHIASHAFLKLVFGEGDVAV